MHIRAGTTRSLKGDPYPSAGVAANRIYRPPGWGPVRLDIPA